MTTTDADAAAFRHGTSAALELLQLARQADASGIIDRSVLTNDDWETLGLGIVFVLHCAGIIVGHGDIAAGLAEIRQLTLNTIAERETDQ